MIKYKALAITSKYWMPGEDYLEEITEAAKGRIAHGDFIVISEKAISTALKNIIDENRVMPGLSAKLIATYWMRLVWGYILGPLCHFRERLIRCLREYPVKMGSHHKQVALNETGLLQALMFGSEGGIDGSNLAYTYVSLSLDKPDQIAEEIRRKILSRLGKKVFVMVVDTDKTYSFRNFHFTPRPKPLESIHSFGGIIAYVIGRMFKLRRRATPTALAGYRLDAEGALRIAEIANRARGSGAGRTVWEMAESFNAALTDVSWEMLKTVKHKPIVIVRDKRSPRLSPDYEDLFQESSERSWSKA